MSGGEPGLPRAEPRHFGPLDRRRVGWLHRTRQDASPRDVGIVICNPFGYEALCAHRSLRHFATTAASIGFQTLRFDYDGTGDSAGDDLDPNRWASWLASVHHAVEELRAATGVSRICLLGMRLGGTLAALAARDSAVIAGLVLIAPITNGKQWLRETRALQAAMGRPPAPERFAFPSTVHESVGLLITETTRTDIAAVDLTQLEPRTAVPVLLIDRSDRPPSTGVVEAWRSSGAPVTHQVLPGYVEMTLDPHEAVVPTAMLSATRRWLEERFAPRASGTVSTTPDGPPSRTAEVAPGVVEDLTFLDDDARLFGVTTAPASTRPSRAVVLLNSGANHHIGNGRLYVKLARRLAAQGWLVLRYDVSGIGESTPHADAPENEVYTPYAVRDLGRALDFLRARHAAGRIELLGLCSGAYHGLKGAVTGQRVDGVVVINPLVFYWKPGMSLAYPPFQVAQDAARYQRSARDPRKWVKLLRGDVGLRSIVRVVWHRLVERTRDWARELKRALGMHVPDDLARDLDALVRRDVRVRFVFSTGDPGEALLRSAAGRRLAQFERSGRVSITHLEACDHSLSSAWMQDALWTRLEQLLGR